MFILGFMAGESGADQIQFGPFCLDVNGSPVFRDGADLKLRPQAVRVLKALLGRPGQSMDYEKLLKQPRGTTFLSRRSVATTFSEMRKTLEEYGSWIGYRLRVGYSLNKFFAGPPFRKMPTGPNLVIGARDICARAPREMYEDVRRRRVKRLH